MDELNKRYMDAKKQKYKLRLKIFIFCCKHFVDTSSVF